MTNGQTLGRLLDERIDDYLEFALGLFQTSEGFDVESPEDFLRQVHRGFANVVRSAAAGDLRARDAYIDSVVRGVRDRGLGLGALMRGMVETSVVLTSWATANGAESSLPWLVEFLGEYTALLAQVYEE